MQYQSFPGVKGGSSSFEKLKCLRLPDVENKRFLDVGCNEGFFCGFAQHQGAKQVVGIDYSGEAIRKAKTRFPGVEFLNQSWDSLPEGPFDVITLLSALHYAEDQAQLIKKLIDLLSDDGVLVLEIGIAPGQKNEWVEVERSIDTRLYPTRRKLASVLEPYAWKSVGYSVKQTGDPLQRYVIHVRKFKPYVYLLMENPGSGKSTICRRLFGKSNVPVVSGDGFYLRIADGKIKGASPRLYELVQDSFERTRIDKVTKQVFEEDLAAELVDLWISESGFKDFALDTYIPADERERVYEMFEDRGYFPVNLSWDSKNKLAKMSESTRRTEIYRGFLTNGPVSNTGQGTFSVRSKRPSALKRQLKWHLDSPVEGELFFEGPDFMVSAWAVPLWDFRQPLKLYVRSGDDQLLKSANVRRDDALRSALGGDYEKQGVWENHLCGFSLTVPSLFAESGLEIGLVVDGEEIPLAEVCVKRARQGSGIAALVSGLLGKKTS